MLPVLLPAPARSDIGRRPSAEEVARQRVFQRRRAEQQSQSRHVAGVRAVRTAKEPVGRRQPGTKAAPAVRIVADRHRNDRAQEKFTGRDVHKRLVYIYIYIHVFSCVLYIQINITRNTRALGKSVYFSILLFAACAFRGVVVVRQPTSAIAAVVSRCFTSSKPARELWERVGGGVEQRQISGPKTRKCIIRRQTRQN